MINKVILRNFKCFNDETIFNTKRLNLLTGINGRGKSSLLQSILVITQSNWNVWEKEENPIYLNSSYIELGGYADIKNSYTTQRDIYIGFEINIGFDTQIQYVIKENEHDNLTLNAMINYDKNRLNVKQISTFFKNIHYVSADRIGPKKYVEKISIPKSIHTGAKGEYAINVLFYSEKLDLTVDEKLYLGKDSYSIVNQTEEWLNYILDGANLNLIGKEDESSVLSLLMNNKKDGKTYKAINIGFGYSYILPLIVTGLIAKPGEVIIVENPEAHLHPRAQSRISEFFARVASTGVQVFIESHSEHILNGLRVASLNKDIEIDNLDINILYFNEEFEHYELQINEKGKVEHWPAGFFDQQDIDISSIFKYSRD
ncbi:DUF3696 domain-containing protein [Flavobacterium sp. LC2016-13]|uniref:DUF3696 domain-containing protein n=1 Tax=Flavobacterium sp. LC2016-13 TaxID=2675875 RepID=UPI0012B71E42|nr:DUF3696 domain-containing protein [Flavobacterium sp. LC2016-13]MTD67754.1 DUF3696 domain-containing protein [Flavobacterium sp. LC2016-13]